MSQLMRERSGERKQRKGRVKSSELECPGTTLPLIQFVLSPRSAHAHVVDTVTRILGEAVRLVLQGRRSETQVVQPQ